MSFSTTVPMQKEYKAADLNGGSIYDSVAGYPYNDASEFEDLINKFKAIILNNGINLLNELSNIKEKPYVSMNKYKKLEQSQNAISESFREGYRSNNFHYKISAKWAHEKNFSYQKGQSEYETFNVSLDIKDVFGVSLTNRADAESNWEYDKLNFNVRVLGKNIIGVTPEEDKIDVELKDQFYEFGFSAYDVIGGGAKIRINLSELGRIMLGLPSRQESDNCGK
ncbi:hypothetical protein [Clostridium sp. AN503]|uniref:hypothetical protein n=1 Tax=Clostridium sp. AN503 TaxID=3160598 RepID=UPI003458BCBF